MNVDLMEQWYNHCSFFDLHPEEAAGGRFCRLLQLEPRQKVPEVEICLVGKRKTKRMLQDTSEGKLLPEKKIGG